ncbi:MAG: Fic family protein [Clostridiales bacterium]|nr:Fic family protein [Clostridiales bacterium]
MDKYNEVVNLWQSYNITTIENLDKYLNSFRVLFAFNSGKIENAEITYHDTREIFENGRVLNYTGNPRALFEQQNQKLAYEFLLDKIVNNEPLSIELIKEIHKILTSGTYDESRYIAYDERPCEFKKHDYVSGIHEVGSPVEMVEDDILELLVELNDYKGEDVLKAASYLHAVFEQIHPFADGNGRAGRAIMNYYLMINNHPPLIIYDEDKRLYYECLQKFDESDDLNPFYEFLKYETEKTWKKALERSKGMKQERKGLSDSIN